MLYLSFPIFIISFSLNAVWEYIHYPLYICPWPLKFCVLVSAFRDALITLVFYWGGRIFSRDHLWIFHLTCKRIVLLAGTALLTAFLIELHGLQGKWTYAAGMPIIPYLNIGWSPLLQMLLLPFLTFFVIKLIASGPSKRYLCFVYAFWAGYYDTVIDPLFHFDRRATVDALQLRPGESVLEVGVGTGLNLPYYPSTVFITGIDISERMLARARQKRKDALLCIMDAKQISFPDNTFDKALSTYALRVIPYPQAVLHEVARVTKPGSVFVIVDQFQENTFILRCLFKLVEPIKLMLGWGKEYDLRKLLKGIPFRIISEKNGWMSGTKLVILENRK